jgi:hypothetical protein
MYNEIFLIAARRDLAHTRSTDRHMENTSYFNVNLVTYLFTGKASSQNGVY